ncbi:hypothetical protein H4R35_004536 [Dimargaris xerosporica]|nr:hypothetical protein H4R35_004536 [Dimargaris xerosporica]
MTPGGEQQFVTDLIDESLQARGVITWYTSLIGRSTTLVPLTQYLVAQGVTNYAIAELCPSRTRRWVLVWTYGLQRIISKQIGNSTLYKCDIRQDFWSRRARRRHQCVFSSTTPSNSKLAAAQQELAIPNGLVVWIVVMNSLATPQEPMLPSDRQIVCASESCQTLLLFVKGSDYETFLSLYNHLKRRLSSLNTNSPL